MSEPKPVDVTYVGPHEVVEVPVGDDLFVFERGKSTTIPTTEAARHIVSGSPDLFKAEKSAPTKEK